MGGGPDTVTKEGLSEMGNILAETDEVAVQWGGEVRGAPAEVAVSAKALRQKEPWRMGQAEGPWEQSGGHCPSQVKADECR